LRGSTTNNLTRAKQSDYLHITFITGTQIVVKKGSGVKEIEDLNGKRMALSLGTTNEKAVKEVAKEKGLNIDYHMVKDHPQAWLALETGRVDAYASDHVLLYGLLSKAKHPEEYEVVGRFLSYDPYGIMIRRDDSAMRLIGNTVLSDAMSKLMVESTIPCLTIVIVAARAVNVPPAWQGRLDPQLCQHGFGLLEVGRVKALREPAIYLRQQVSSCCVLPLPLPEPRQAQRRAQLQRLGLLALGHLQGTMEHRFRLGDLGAGEVEQ
jgi:hypothetical protein